MNDSGRGVNHSKHLKVRYLKVVVSPAGLPPLVGRTVMPRSETDRNDRSCTMDERDSAVVPLLSSSRRFSSIAMPRLISLKAGCILLNFLIEMFDMIVTVPQLALLEGSLCSSYYATRDLNAADLPVHVTGQSCKIEPIQKELAILRGWKAFLDAVPSK